MNKAFEKILERLEENQTIVFNLGGGKPKQSIDYTKAVEIVQEVAEEFATDTNVGTNGWIPVSERLPEEPFGCLVTVIDCEPYTQTQFDNILPYFVGYDGESWNDADGEEIPFEVIAWQPLPECWKGENNG